MFHLSLHEKGCYSIDARELKAHGRCKDPTQVRCCLEEHHVGACNGNMSEQEYAVECITAEKLVRKKRLYRVKWKGWPEDDSTWQSEASLVDATECVAGSG